VSDVYADDIPDMDILTGGFPCQTFSARGKQKGLGDPRGQLYLELVRILKMKQPKAFLFENVAALVTMDGGRRNKRTEPLSAIVIGQTFKLMLEAFKEVGYHVSWRILNSRHWLPQMRERVYIIGIRKDLSSHGMLWENLGGEGNMTKGPGAESKVRDILERPDSMAVAKASLSQAQWDTIQAPEFEKKAGRWPSKKTASKLHERAIDLEGKAPTLTSSYHRSSSFSTKYIFEESDCRMREIPRFLTPRGDLHMYTLYIDTQSLPYR